MLSFTAMVLLGVVNKADGTATLIDLKSKTPQLTVTAGYLPHEMAISPDGRRAVISNYGKDHVRSTSPLNHPGNTLTVVDLTPPFKQISLGLSFNSASASEPDMTPCAPHGMAFAKDSNSFYVTCENRQEVAVVDTESGLVSHRIPTGQEQSHMIALSPDGARAYVANFSSGSISVLDLKARKLIAIIPTGAGTEGVSVSPDGRFAFASSVLENRLVKIDTANLKVVASATTDRSPVRNLVSPNGKWVLTANSSGNSVEAFDTETLELVKRIPVGRQPIGFVVPNDDRAYVAAMNENLVYEIDLKKGEVIDRIKTGNKPDGLAYGASPLTPAQ